ncbi:hypothetical protein Pth03_73010 [Planotetraspora thailandica]|uniref:Integral membrane protein n=1 Tax=Planotetraspora thailandica TaxID=487172 RepID=A0A8J3Y124_9ACTN|nr:hypothetical protein [Planotetraspora thailandica]GII58912.1 hypothetical protein Pth03_73010 [Planotetraspora thailandica]
MISHVTGRPATLTVAAVVLAAEGLLALALGCYAGIGTLVGQPADMSTALAEAALGVLIGAGLLWVAWGVWQIERWSRGPGVVTQIFALPVSFSLIGGGQYAYGVPLVVAAVVGLVALLAPKSTEALMGEGGSAGSRGPR